MIVILFWFLRLSGFVEFLVVDLNMGFFDGEGIEYCVFRGFIYIRIRVFLYRRFRFFVCIKFLIWDLYN